MNLFFTFLHKYSFRSRICNKILSYFQKRCSHLIFTYDSDTDCSYCERCGSGFWSGNFYDEIYASEFEDFENETGE